MSDGRPAGIDPATAEALRALEMRVARVEALLAQAHGDAANAAATRHNGVDTMAVSAEDGTANHDATAPDFEFVVGQNWLASVGILVLTCGVGFALLLPFAGLPPWLPSLAGVVLAAGLGALGFRWHRTFSLVAGYFRGAAMALFFCAVLRLYFISATPVLDIDGVVGRALLLLVVGGNVAAALARRSAWLMTLALLTGFMGLVAIGAPWVVFIGVAALLTVGAWAAVTRDGPWLPLFLIPSGYFTFAVWLVNRPWQGRPFELQLRPAAGVFFVLLYALINAAATYRRRARGEEDAATIFAVLLNCGLGYALFLLATAGGVPAVFAPAHLAAAGLFLGLGLAFWQSEESRIPTFCYAMTGYLALSMALIKLVPVPQLFIWLSGQSLLVVATALWFRSKLIVVGNFFIYLGIVLAYVLTIQAESGISIGFGIVALLTARILRWQAERLELRTELMRNAYLASAFVIFPYALYHLVSRAYVSVSWVAMAVTYYVMNLVVRSPKYRWMGHLTLLLTALYMIVVGIFQLAPAYRVASFLLLGTVLLVVSLIFTLLRARRREAAEDRGTPPV